MILLPVQAVMLLSTIIAVRMLSIDRQLRRETGIPRHRRNARAAQPPVPAHPPPWLWLSRVCATVAAVVLNVIVVVPVVVSEFKATAELPVEQVGRFVVPEGAMVSEQVRVTVPT
jgi:hypothetical protein